MSIDNITIPKVITDCQAHKGDNVRFAKRIWYANTYDTLAAKIYSCGCDISTQGNKIVASNFCRERLCPVCQWRRSQKLSYQNDLVLKSLEGKYRFIFLTLTVRNVSLGNIKSTVQLMQRGYKALYQRTWFKGFGIQGYVRSLEITYNSQTDTWHPHLHCILACDQGSWLPSHKFFVSEWASCLGSDYAPYVDIRVARSLHEVSKYIVKSKDMLKGFDFAQIHNLEYELKGLRFVSYGGVIRVERKRLLLDNPETGSLVDEVSGADPIIDWHFDYSKLIYGVH